MSVYLVTIVYPNGYEHVESLWDDPDEARRRAEWVEAREQYDPRARVVVYFRTLNLKGSQR
jgi:hypothetical protein